MCVGSATELAERDLLPHEVDVELDMFGATMVHRVRRHVDRRNIVAVDHRGFGDDDVKLTE